MATLQSLADLNRSNVESTRATRRPVHVQKLDAQGRAYATGKRKDAVARVWIKPGTGKVIGQRAAPSRSTSPARCCA